jgi:hypothetical protein
MPTSECQGENRVHAGIATSEIPGCSRRWWQSIPYPGAVEYRRVATARSLKLVAIAFRELFHVNTCTSTVAIAKLNTITRRQRMVPPFSRCSRMTRMVGASSQRHTILCRSSEVPVRECGFVGALERPQSY